jgi:transposase
MVTEDASFSTIDCHACGHREKFDASVQVWHTCPACGELWDQDCNAARVILNRKIVRT